MNMSFEELAKKVVDKMNKDRNLKPTEGFHLEHWFGGLHGEFHQAAIYKSGKPLDDRAKREMKCFSHLFAWSDACDKCGDYETACRNMLRVYLVNVGSKIDFSTPSELEVKMVVCGLL